MIHKGGGAPLPWLLELTPAALARLYEATGTVLDEIAEDED